MLLTLAAGVSPSPRVVRFMGPSAAEVLGGATRVEAFRVKAERANKGEEAVGGYIARKPAAAHGEAFAARLAGVLLDEKSYRFDARTIGGFNPTAGFRVWAKDRRVEVLYSPATDEVVVFSPPAADGSVRSAQADFAPAREALAALVKEALPGE